MDSSWYNFDVSSFLVSLSPRNQIKNTDEHFDLEVEWKFRKILNPVGEHSCVAYISIMHKHFV